MSEPDRLWDRADMTRRALLASDAAAYADAPHAWFADYRPSYREADTKNGWQRLQNRFKANDLA
jgi:carboxymethylenebutenolidase